MSSNIGLQAEQIANAYLRENGFLILTQNWRSRWSEIDIIARLNLRIHFVEVKYRSRSDHGAGVDYVTQDKASRLRRAATAWVQHSGWAGPYQIDVISVAGSLDDPKVEYFPNAIQD